MILVDAHGVAASRPGKPLFDGLSLTVASGDRVAIVGINGSGKSTLLGVLSGTVEPEAGVVRRGRGARVVALDQAASLPDGSVRAAVGDGWQAEAVLDRLGLGDLLAADVGDLSGGQAKRVALARSLVALGEGTEADLLILDEPTNHLDLDSIAWLEDRLAGFAGGLVLVTHDRLVLDRLTTRIVELDSGAAHVHDGGYASYLEARAERAAREVTAERARRNLARAELAWLRRGAPARTRKPRADVAAARAVVEARAPEPVRPAELPLADLVQMPRLGDTVVELHGVSDGYGDELLFEDLDLGLGPGERLGVVGVNGSGKSTLLDLLAGRRRPRSGEVRFGRTVRVGYYDQRGSDLPPDVRVRQVVAGPARQPDGTDAALLERLWFDADAQWAPVELLSGGERRRLQLALVLREGPNVLLLDEPTNDLDLDTLRALEDLLDGWPGTLVVVSHDRAFLERTVEDVVVVERGARVGRVPGGYAAYEEERRRARRSGRVGGPGPAGVPRPAALPGTLGPGPGSPGPGTVPGAPGEPVAGAPSGRRRGDGSGGTAAVGHPPGGPATRTPSTLRHLLRRADADLRRLQERRSSLEAELGDAGDDHVTLARLGRELSAVAGELAAAEESWLALAGEAEARGLPV
ncbi:MAG TPA: ABC-F family ATP-binding cassette domain-containing protein [Acidimicrobiales bacterium]|nr:ABC-F family ATP-binding cassette domain-containing protein [Acidimicrobiales bacterium]